MKHTLPTLLLAALALPGASAVFAQSYAGGGAEPASAVLEQPAAGAVTRDGIPPLPGARNSRWPPATENFNDQSGVLSQFGTFPSRGPASAPLTQQSGMLLSPEQTAASRSGQSGVTPNRPPIVTPDGVPPADGAGAIPLPGMPGSFAPNPIGDGASPLRSDPFQADSSVSGTLSQPAMPSNPASLSHPIDHLTGLPLRMTSRWPTRDGALLPLPPPTEESPIPSPVPHARIRAQPGHYPVRPLDRVPPSDLLPTPDLPHLPGLPGPSYSGPVLFDGQVDGLIGDPLTRDANALPLDTPPNPEIDFPQDTLLDPPLFDAGNGDGQLDWIDLIEEYAGRATRSDIPDEPHNAPKEERSWLRVEHWRADATWLPATGNDLGWLTGYGDIVIGLPKIRGLTITPAYAYHMLEGPKQTDMPNTLHDLSAQVAWMRRFDARWRLRIAGTVGFYSEHLNLRDGMRFSGQSLVTYECNPDLQFVAGTALLNLENQQMLPIGGLIWTINDRHRLDLIFPEWKFAFVAQESLLWTKWAYETGGFWGRTWEIERTGGGKDDVTYSDWRIAVGMEKKSESDIYSFLEFGIAFDRKLDYVSNVGDYTPDTFGFVRGGLHF